MKKILAVYDVDALYAARFAEVMNQKDRIPFEVTAFATWEELEAFGKEHTIDVLLVSPGISSERLQKIGAGRVLILEDGECRDAGGEYQAVYKFQSSDAMIREVMACYSEETEAAPGLAVGTMAKIIGIFSPMGGCGKTSFAVTLGRTLARENKTLYVNLEECSGLSSLTQTEFRTGLSDLLYYQASGRYHPLRLSGAIHSMGELDYIPPVRYPEDLAQGGAKQTAALLQAIAESSSYQILVADVGGWGKTALPVLRLCSQIYMPVREDPVSLAKISEFEGFLRKSGNERILDRICRIRLPRSMGTGRGEDYFEQLLWTELGDFVRNLVHRG